MTPEVFSPSRRTSPNRLPEVFLQLHVAATSGIAAKPDLLVTCGVSARFGTFVQFSFVRKECIQAGCVVAWSTSLPFPRSFCGGQALSHSVSKLIAEWLSEVAGCFVIVLSLRAMADGGDGSTLQKSEEDAKSCQVELSCNDPGNHEADSRENMSHDEFSSKGSNDVRLSDVVQRHEHHTTDLPQEPADIAKKALTNDNGKLGNENQSQKCEDRVNTEALSAASADGRDVELSSGAEESQGGIVLNAKWGTKWLQISITETDFETFSVADLKLKIQSDCNIPCDRQKFLGMASGKKALHDSDLLSSLTFKKRHSFILVGTPLDQALVDHSATSSSQIVNDLEWDFVPVRDELPDIRNETHLKRLRRAIEKTNVHLINAPRPGKKLLVLDLDNTVFDCKGASPNIEELKRPFLEYFMQEVYQDYDLAVWSQTHWKWVEMKCTDLGFLTSSSYNLCFVLDRSSMFSVCSRQRDGSVRSHEVKALELIWEKFPELWGPHNTLHVDDLGRNFALNPKNGVKVSSYRVDKKKADSELLILARYLKRMSTVRDLAAVDHSSWKKKAKYELFEL